MIAAIAKIINQSNNFQSGIVLSNQLIKANQSNVDIRLAATDQWNAIYYPRSTSNINNMIKVPFTFLQKTTKQKQKKAKSFFLSTNKKGCT